MALTATQVNCAGPAHYAFGKRSGTRTAANFEIELGFEPQYVKVCNVTDRITGEWQDGAELLTVAAGTRTAASTGIAVSGSTVTVTVATAGLETNDDVVVWEARG